MSRFDTLELTLHGIAQGGEAVGRVNGRVIFAAGGLPGEHVRVQLQDQSEQYARGVVTEVLSASADRVEPRLPTAEHMPWQIIAYSAQLQYKRQILIDQLTKFGGVYGVAVDQTLASPRPWGYRNSAELHVVAGQIGYHASGTQQLVPLTGDDPLLHPALNRALDGLRQVIHPDDPVESVRLRVSEADGYVLAVIRGRGMFRDLADDWRRRCSVLAGVSWFRGSVGGNDLIEEFGGIQFLLRPETFFQANLPVASQMLRLVRQLLALKPEEQLLDLFCGAGAFALPFAGFVQRVVGIEESRWAIEDGQRSAQANRCQNVQFLAGKVEMMVPQIEEQFDAVILDPPRRGCHPRTLAALQVLAPARIVYISCHPATLARDVKLLVDGGYQVTHCTPVDMFPQTPHVESVTLLEHRKQ